MLLRSDSPALQSWPRLQVCGRCYGGTVEVIFRTKRQPAVAREGRWEIPDKGRGRSTDPLGELGCTPGMIFQKHFWRLNLRQVGAYYTEVVMYPGERWVIDSIGRREQIFGVCGFRSDEARDRRVIDKHLGAHRQYAYSIKADASGI